MAVLRNRGGGNTGENGEATVENESTGASGYEQFRDQRIRENKERLQKLGILDLALKLKTEAAAPKRPHHRPKTHNPIPGSGSPRRSSRHKTLGHHTRCLKCDLVQGQFCGDCLYMRYGENVMEASENRDWTCPVCRGICNCNCCRQAKGWEPTGNVYRKVVKLGYKSVAHYLIQTHHPSTNTETTGEEVLAEVSTPSAETFSHDESSGIGSGSDTSKHVGDNDVGNADAVAVDSEAKKKLRRSTRLSRN